MSDFTNTTAQTLADLRTAEDKLSNMIWNAGNILEQFTSQQMAREQIESLSRTFAENAQTVQQALHSSVANLERISSGLPHEDSCYGASIDLNLAATRNQTIRNKFYQLKNNVALQQSRQRLQHLQEQLAQL